MSAWREVGQVYRLVTTLLNARLAPARALIALYHERWEIELVIDEIKTHERAQRKVLRSKTPEGVRKAPLRDLLGPSSTNPRSARCLHLSPLILRISFLILSTCLILSPPSFPWEVLK